MCETDVISSEITCVDKGGKTMVQAFDTAESYQCPICKDNNNCCNSIGKSLGICWCSGEFFPKAILELVPYDQLRKSCICKKCLDEFVV
ncbi:cysteine-rich CWC family protein [Sporosarcina sp. BP05]|uniref:cysteine-rich CWC family protein n=1 Tax=Sporosarcina sp. BP05 TaxID=2758726 RepID=UPI00351C9DA6